MATNITSLPLLQVTFETANNEDWLDSIAFVVAGNVTFIANRGNFGNGNVVSMSSRIGAYVGAYTLTMTSASTYHVEDPNDTVIGTGAVGTAFTASGLTFTLETGTVPFASGDELSIIVLPRPLDITGIRFVMELRTSPESPTVLLGADSRLGSIVTRPEDGVLSLNVLKSKIQGLAPSPAASPYSVDILALADGNVRRCVTGSVNLIQGVTVTVS